MKIHATLRARYSALSYRKKQVVLGVSAALLCLCMIVLIMSCQAISANKRKAPVEPMVMRQGDKITIPRHSPLRSQLILESVHSSNVPHKVSFPGFIEADPARTVNVLPPLTGRLLALNVKLGDRVRRNQVLAVISSPDLAQAYSDHEKARGVLTLTSDALKRAKSVNRAGGNAVKDVQWAQNNYDQAFAEVRRSKARLHALGHNKYSRLIIKAPISGNVVALNYGRGSYINDATAALLRISNIKKLWVTANVPENLVRVVSKDLPVKIYLSAYPDQEVDGKIAFVSSYLDPDTHRNKTRIAIENGDERLQPNMFATVKLMVPQPNVVMIPLTAILMNDDTTSVYVETTPWVFERREVTLGAEDGQAVRVVSGLKAGERIAVRGGIFIND